MLTTAERMAAKLAEALSSPPLKHTDVAAACGVTKQAVQGWLRTGRFDKRHLPTLARITNKPLEWWLSSDESLSVDDEQSRIIRTLSDASMQASPRSMLTIEKLTELAKRNALKDEDWALIEQIASKIQTP